MVKQRQKQKERRRKCAKEPNSTASVAASEKNERKICAPFCPQRRLTNPDYYLDWDNKETKQTI